MKRFAGTAAVAFALANLYLLFLTGPLVSSQHQLIFHLPGSATALFVPVVLDLLGCFLALLASLWLTRHHPRLELAVWAAVLLPLPAVLVGTVAAFAGHPPRPWLLWWTIFLAAAGFAFVLVRARTLLPGFQRLRAVLTTVLSFVALSSGVLLAQLLWFGWQARNLNPPFRARTVAASRDFGSNQRVVWIILDELSYRQVYGHRLPGLALPNFDRLAAEATLFPNAHAAAQYTRIAVPALLTGIPLSATSPTGDDRHLLLHRRGASGWTTLRPANTIFGDVAARGQPTGIAGWYEPYCRVLRPVLDRCFWIYSDEIPGHLSGQASIRANLLGPWRRAFSAGLHLVGLRRAPPSEGALDVQRHAADFRALSLAGDRLLEQQTSGLLLLHMPIPHPWGFYDRRTHSFPSHRTSYLDNLALADAYLGHVRALLERTGEWDRTNIVIMGDHGWRTSAVWRRSGFWTPEEQLASLGSAPEDNPAVIVKLRGQHTPARVDAAFDAVRTRALIDALMRGQLQTPAELQRWTARMPAR